MRCASIMSAVKQGVAVLCSCVLLMSPHAFNPHACQGLDATFHRAFDMTPDPIAVSAAGLRPGRVLAPRSALSSAWGMWAIMRGPRDRH